MDILAALGCELGEGARLIGGRLHVVDILRGRVYRWSDDGPQVIVSSDQPIGAVAGVIGRPDQVVLAEGLGVSLVTLDRPDERHRLVRTLSPLDHRRTHRVNDAACDPFGRFWIGTMPYDEGPAGAVYRVAADGAVDTVMGNLPCPNGPAFGTDGSVYLADSTAGVILSARLGDTGEVGPFSRFAELDHGSPDGMTVDQDGCLWVAVWGAGEVRRYDPAGRLVTTLAVPARQPTSVCLMSVEGQSSLVVTSARVGLADPGPADGAVLVAPVEATAPPAGLFGTA